MPATSVHKQKQRNKPTISHIIRLVVGLSFVTLSSFAQMYEYYEAPLDTTIFTVVEHQPEFPGGFGALKEYMLKNVRYPAEAQKACIKGRVFTSFVVEVDGRLTNAYILRGLGYGCDEEALRVVNAMPRWIPGSQSGKPIRVRYNLPVLFGVDYPKPGKR
jgi:protein TonB